MSFQEYEKKVQSLNLQEMSNIHQMILDAINNDNDAKELYNELMEISVEYANIRAKWLLMSNQEKMNQDSLRTAYHNSMIVHLNMLARLLKKNNKNTQWRDILGYEEDNSYNRKRMGDFACYLAFINALLAR